MVRVQTRWGMLGMSIGALAACVPSARGAINLSLMPSQGSVAVGSSLGIDIVARSTTLSGEGAYSFQVIFSWDPSRLRLTGVSTLGVPELSSAGFFSDAYGLNESSLPSDGTAVLIGFGPFGSSIHVPGAGSTGLSLSTLHFLALAPSASSSIGLLASAGSPVGRTIVFGDAGPNVNATGALSGATVQIVPAPATVMTMAMISLCRGRRRAREGCDGFRYSAGSER